MKQFVLNPYGLSGLALAIVFPTLARRVMTPLWGSGYTFISYYPAIIFTVWVGGWKVGLLATIVSGRLSPALFAPLKQIRETIKACGAVGFVMKESCGQLYQAISHAVA